MLVFMYTCLFWTSDSANDLLASLWSGLVAWSITCRLAMLVRLVQGKSDAKDRGDHSPRFSLKLGPWWCPVHSTVARWRSQRGDIHEVFTCFHLVRWFIYIHCFLYFKSWFLVVKCGEHVLSLFLGSFDMASFWSTVAKLIWLGCILFWTLFDSSFSDRFAYEDVVLSDWISERGTTPAQEGASLCGICGEPWLTMVQHGGEPWLIDVNYG